MDINGMVSDAMVSTYCFDDDDDDNDNDNII